MDETQIKFPGSITRIEVDTFRDQIIIEFTLDSAKQYSMISRDNSWVEKRLKFALDTSEYFLSAVSNGFLAFTKIVDPTRQEEQEILIYDLDSSEIIEKIEERKFSGFRLGKSLEVVHLGFESVRKEIIELNQYRDQESSESNPIVSPFLIYPGMQEYETLKKIAENYLKKELSYDLEVLEYNGRVIIGVHTIENQKMGKSIIVIDDSELKYRTEIYNKLDKRTTDTFFVYSNFLIFVSEYNKLHLLDTSIL